MAILQYAEVREIRQLENTNRWEALGIFKETKLTFNSLVCQGFPSKICETLVNLRSKHESIWANLNLLRYTHLREPLYKVESLVTGTKLFENPQQILIKNVSPGQPFRHIGFCQAQFISYPCSLMTSGWSGQDTGTYDFQPSGT